MLVYVVQGQRSNSVDCWTWLVDITETQEKAREKVKEDLEDAEVSWPLPSETFGLTETLTVYSGDGYDYTYTIELREVTK